MSAELFDSPLFTIPVLTGSIFFIMGFIMKVFPPKAINGLYGYRTTKSMQDQRHWDFAQRYSTVLMMKYSVLLSLSAVLAFVISLPVYLELGISIGLLVGMVIALFIKTEKALKALKNSD